MVEISSSDEEEDNDIIMMSEEEDDKDEEEDMENSGSHVNDALNRPDAQGCVLVNVGHPSEELDIFLAPQLASIVKPHQVNVDFNFYMHCLVSYCKVGIISHQILFYQWNNFYKAFEAQKLLTCL